MLNPVSSIGSADYCSGDRLTDSPYANSSLTDGLTSETPFTICTVEQFFAVGSNSGDWSKHFELRADLEANDTGDTFLVIGNSVTSFTGSFNGSGYTISNIIFDSLGEDYAGVFGRGTGCTVRNLNLANVDIDGANYAGGLMGMSQSCEIGSVIVTGSVTGSTNVGGLVGAVMSNSSLVVDSYSKCSVVSTGNYAGGLVGQAISGGIIARSYSTGNVEGADYVGGIAGSFSNVSYSFALGDVTGTVGTHVGLLLGNSTTGATVSHSSVNATCVGTPSCDGTEGTHSQGDSDFNDPTNSPLDHWDFDTYWIDNLQLNETPTLRYQQTVEPDGHFYPAA